MVDKKVEINFLTESDAYRTWKDEITLKIIEELFKFTQIRKILEKRFLQA